MNAAISLAALAAEDFSKVIRITRQKLQREGKSIFLDDQEAETALRQYYALPILEYPCQRFAISSVVDSYWHTHVLDTREYRHFCRRVYGYFMDHVPLDAEKEVDFWEIRALYASTRNLLVKHFDSDVSPKAYPQLVGEGRDVVICSYDYCVTAEYLREAA